MNFTLKEDIEEYKSFTTQADMKRNLRHIINKIGIHNNIRGKYPKEYKYLTQVVIPRHPNHEEKMDRMINLGIQKNERYKNLEFYIIYTELDIEKKTPLPWELGKRKISIMKNCVSGKHTNKISDAMRKAVEKQILDYKKKLKVLKCEKCESEKNIQIDHVKDFVLLQNEFVSGLDKKIKIPYDFDCDIIDNRKVFKDNENDNKFKKLWYDYHKEHAVLRPLCKKCNNNRKKYKKNF